MIKTMDFKREDHKTSQQGDCSVNMYPNILPDELKQWYVYSYLKGHCIRVLPSQAKSQISTDDVLEDHLISVPVKTVLKGYLCENDGMILFEGFELKPDMIVESDMEFDELRPKFTSERLRIQRSKIIDTIAQHCAFIRCSKIGKKNADNLKITFQSQSFSGFMDVVDAHLDVAEQDPTLKTYISEIETLLSYYDQRIISNNHETFVSDNSGKSFRERYNQVCKSLTIKK